MDIHLPQRENADYDAEDGRRWFFRLYMDAGGGWRWEPREPTPTELSVTTVVRGISWRPTVLEPADWPPENILGPYTKRGDAISALEDWFNARR